VRGADHSLSALKDRVILLSFVDLQAPAGTGGVQPSRAQITFLKSMHVQYSPKGLETIIVDGTRLRSGRPADRDAVYNATFNWNLNDITVINDEAQDSITARYEVTQLPTTLLIAKGNRIAQRWDGVASTPSMSHALQELLGRPVISYPSAPGARPSEPRQPRNQHPRIVPPAR